MRLQAVRAIILAIVSAVGIASVVSCVEDAAPGTAPSTDKRLAANSSARPMLPTDPSSGGQAAGPAVGKAGVSSANLSDAPVPPPDAQWTLHVYTERSPAHVQDASMLRRTLVRMTNRSDWYVIHAQDESNLYLGFYRSIADPRDAAAAKASQADLQLAKGLELKDTDGQPMKAFEHAMFVPLAAPDPAAPPEWNLTNVDLQKRPKDPTRAFWSLQIMAFKANALRKEAAVQAVQALRKNGVEAYYYHGETVSSVCVGAWPMDSVEHQTNDGDHTVADPTHTLYVYPGELPQGAVIPEKDSEGHRIVAVAPVLRIRDKTMKEMIARYPDHSINYDTYHLRGRDNRLYPDPSFLVVIPRAKGNGYYDSQEDVTPGLVYGNDPAAVDRRDGLPSEANTQTILPGALPPPPAASGLGRLRRLGEN